MIPCASCFVWEFSGMFGPELQQRAVAVLASELTFPLLYSAVTLTGLFYVALLLKQRSSLRKKKAAR